jgi:hypothetical protein
MSASSAARVDPNGVSNTIYEIPNLQSLPYFSRLRSASSNAKRAHFSVLDESSGIIYLIQMSFETNQESRKLQGKLIAQFPSLAAQTDYWLLGDEDDVFIVETSRSLNKSWRVRWYRGKPCVKELRFNEGCFLQ